MEAYLQAIQEGGIIGWEDGLEVCAEALPLLRELSVTPQDPEWHGEGDVAIHTAMVLERLAELLRIEGWRFSAERWFVLWMATFLHDIGKPLTTRKQEIDGRLRIVAPHHAQRGASYLVYRLLEMGIPVRLVLDIVALVGSHHEPKHFVKRDVSFGRQWMLAEACDLQALYLLEKADMLGRICSDQQEQIEIMELFRMLCEESGGWQGAGLFGQRGLEGWYAKQAGWGADTLREMLRMTFHSESDTQHERLWRESLWDLAEGLYTRPEEAVSRAYRLVREGRGALTLLVGPSGAGKSTWITKYAGSSEVISLDQIREDVTGDAGDQHENTRVLHQARDRLKEALRKGRDVIWDATSLRRDSRSMLIQIARDYGVHTTQVVFCAPMNEIFRRNRQREKSIPTSALKRQFAALEWPDIHEAHRTIFVDAEGCTAYDSRDILVRSVRSGRA